MRKGSLIGGTDGTVYSGAGTCGAGGTGYSGAGTGGSVSLSFTSITTAQVP